MQYIKTVHYHYIIMSTQVCESVSDVINKN